MELSDMDHSKINNNGAQQKQINKNQQISSGKKWFIKKNGAQRKFITKKEQKWR